MERSVLTVLLSAFGAALLSGCMQLAALPPSLHDLSMAHADQPRLAVVYYPYGPAAEDAIARPHPDFSGWTDQAMRVNLNQIRGVDVDLLLVRTDVRQALADPSCAERYQSFARHADSAGQPFALYVDGTGIEPSTFAAFLRWVAALGLHQSAACLKDEQRPVVFVANGSQLRNVQLIGLVVRHWEFKAPAEFAGASALADARLDPVAGVIEVLAAKGRREADGEVSWQLPRRGGRTLKSAILTAAELRPVWIVVESWNNFADGSFIQPNSLDSRELSRALQVTASRLKPEAVN